MTSRPYRWPLRAFSGLLACLSIPGTAFSQASSVAIPSPSGYVTEGQCAGFPRLPLKTPEGWCAGLVADERDGLRMPRRLLELSPDRFWITDMGNWEPKQGRLLELRATGQPGDPKRVRVLAKGLDRPHGLVRGPDGRIYVGEAGAIWRTPSSQVERELVVSDLPDDGAHPLTEMVFAPPGTLYINVGSATDACRPSGAQPSAATDAPGSVCPETAAPQPRAAVYQAVFGGPDFKRQTLEPWAHGLRNSLGLAITRDTTSDRIRLWQAENSVDYTDPLAPAEELNELFKGASYGWPYCVTNAQGRNVALDDGRKGAKKRVQCPSPEARAPFMAWPAHVAPLQLLAVPAAKPGDLETPWSGRLLAVWHGYRAQGHRIVAWRLGPLGQPEGEREDLVSDWEAVLGLRPLGNPAGITVDSRGRLWIVEDRNRTVIVIAPQTPLSAAR
ncbi:MAG: PQQ-dependent sugar dehydrogenase [Burkholderiaceae bacterium]